MFILRFIPDSYLLLAVNFTLLVGLVLITIGVFGNIASRIVPLITPYTSIIKIVGICIFIFGIYFKGGYSAEMEWRTKVEDLQKKMKLAEESSKKVNAKLEQSLAELNVSSDKKNSEIHKNIQTNEQTINGTCVVTPEIINILNRAAGIKDEK